MSAVSKSVSMRASLILFVCITFCTGASAQTPETKSILILNSYHQGYSWSDGEISGLMESLLNIPSIPTTYIEHLDYKRFSENYETHLTQYLATKYYQLPLDLIVVLDNPALQFIVKHRGRLFPKIPVVFCGINHFRPELVSGHSDITGVEENQDHAGTIDLILRLHPATRRIFAVHDYTASGIAVRKEFESIVPRYQHKVEIIMNEPMSFDELKQAIKSQPADTVVVILSFTTDRMNNSLPLSDSTRIITADSQFPVYAMHETRLGHGIVGGMLISAREHGLKAAELVKRVLTAEPPHTIPVITEATSTPMFDYAQLRKFGINPESLPTNSIVFGKPLSFYELNKTLVWIVAIAIVFLIGLTIALTRQLLKRKEFESVLKKSEDNYRRLSDDMPGLLCTFDPRGNLLYVNKAYQDFFKITAEELIGSRHPFISDPLVLQSALESVQKLTPEAPVSTYEQKTLSPEGDIVFQTWTNRAFFDSNGTVTGYQAIGLDTTDRQLAEQALKESEEKYRRIVETAAEGIWAMDGQFITTFVNKRMSDMIGYSADEMVGTPVHSFMFPEDLDDHRSKMDVRQIGENSIYERRFKKKNGDELWTVVSATALKEPNGDFAGSFAMFTDITDRKYAERALKSSEERYRAVFNNAGAGIVLFDAAGGLLQVNAAFALMLGYEQRELQKLTFVDLLDRSNSETFSSHSAAIFHAEIDSYRSVYKFIKTNGEPLWAEVSVSPLINVNGVYGAALAVVTDISERKKAQELLVQSERIKAVAELSAGVSHNFNNVLQIVIGGTSLALMYLETDSVDQIRTQLDQVLQSARFGAETVKRLQDFAKFSDVEKGTGSKPFNITNTIKQAIEMSKPWWKTNAERKGIQIDIINFAEGPMYVAGKENEIFEVIVNILKNAVEALPEGGDIVIRSKLDSHNVVIEIEDSGVGIREENINNIFEPFWTSKGLEGTGMGLACSYGIIKRHSGNISVRTEFGKGSCFSIALPQCTDIINEDVPRNALIPFSYRFLVIDDQENIVNSITRGLMECGQTAIGALSGAEALNLFSSQPVDVIVCDLGMPELNGWQVGSEIKRLCQKSNLRKPLFIILTGWGDQANENQLMAQSGVDAIMRKPADIFEILSLVGNLTK